MLIFELQLKVKNEIKLNYEKLYDQNGNKTYREMITYDPSCFKTEETFD